MELYNEKIRTRIFNNSFFLFLVTVVDSIDYYIGEEYVEGVMESCRNVIVPATGGVFH